MKQYNTNNVKFWEVDGLVWEHAIPQTNKKGSLELERTSTDQPHCEYLKRICKEGWGF